MLLWVSQQIIISFIFIVLIHSIYTFLQNNLTTPKIRDLVNISNEKYKDIYKTIEQEDKKDVNTVSMKNELQSYLKELSTTSAETPQDTKIASNNNVFSDNFTTNYEMI
tara:strand:+ start:894 stop:1220 length:327 start_codon:yes stop_codon:yes gene_type:complete